MHETSDALRAGGAAGTSGGTLSPGEQQWSPPTFQVIALDCEVTAYAPDEGDAPLF